MIGVKDVAFHLLHIIKKENIDESKLYKSSFTKVIFIAYSQCFLHELPMKYDILFLKSEYGASSSTIADLVAGRFDRNVSTDNAKENTLLSENRDLNERFHKLILRESQSPFSFAGYITNSDVFQNSGFQENKEKSIFNREMLLLPMEIDQVWTLPEIMLFAEVDKEKIEEYDHRVPLNERTYNAIGKYLNLYDKYLDNMDAEVSLTLDDIHTMRYVSEQLLDVVRTHGARIENGLST